MRSEATSIAHYLDEVEDRWSGVAKAIVGICDEELVGDVATMRYGMPCWSRGEDAELAFAVQRRHLSLYVMRSVVLDEHRAELSGHSVGKGCVRFGTPDSVDLSLVRRLVAATAADDGPIC